MAAADFEKLGAFYLGRAVDTASGVTADAPVLYDSKDLTTHAVIIGMTGSGKTGLGIGMIEEAALDGIPVIAVDPKGDMGNLLLSFPSLTPSKFEPWVNPAEAANRGQSISDYAAAQAALWKKGLGEWGQKPSRIKALRNKVEMAIYNAGLQCGAAYFGAEPLCGTGRVACGTTSIFTGSECRLQRPACWCCSASTPTQSRAANISLSPTFSTIAGRTMNRWTCRP